MERYPVPEPGGELTPLHPLDPRHTESCIWEDVGVVLVAAVAFVDEGVGAL
jgi:hypothetical protein